jgi:hypothetical protein
VAVHGELLVAVMLAPGGETLNAASTDCSEATSGMIADDGMPFDIFFLQFEQLKLASPS